MIGSLALASACGQSPVDERSGTEADSESGQGRALEVGRALVGKPAPAAQLRTIDGETIDLGAIYGREPVYLKFWATWCVVCREQMPSFEADYRKYRDKIVTVAVNTGFNDNEAAVRKYRQQHGLTMPITIDDGTLGQALNLRVTPQHVVVGRNGRILFVGHEGNDDLHKALEAAIAQQPATAAAVPSVRGQSYRIGEPVQRADPALVAAAGFPITGVSRTGKPRIIFFFSPWCESYLKESRPDQARACGRVREDVNRLAKTGRYDLIGVSSGLWASSKDLEDYRTGNALRIPTYLDADGKVFRSFGVQDVPTMIEIDREGRVARRTGPNDDLKDTSEAGRAG